MKRRPLLRLKAAGVVKTKWYVSNWIRACNFVPVRILKKKQKNIDFAELPYFGFRSEIFSTENEDLDTKNEEFQ